MSVPLVRAPIELPSSGVLSTIGSQYRGSSDLHGEYFRDGAELLVPSGARSGKLAMHPAHVSRGPTRVPSAGRYREVSPSVVDTMWKPSALKSTAASLVPSGEGWGEKTPVAASVARVIVTGAAVRSARSEEHTSELQSQSNLVCRLLLEKKK